VHHFELREGELACEEVHLARIAEAVGTPAYVYSTATFERHYRVFRGALADHSELGEPLVAYALKANGALSVVRTLAGLGAGADTVSEGEIRRALAAGVPARRIVFSGVGKTARELAFALDVGVRQINVESEPELELLARIARDKSVAAPLAFRANPGVGAGGHDKITTGQADSKFGVAIGEVPRLYAAAASEPGLEPVGLACHIGSQITELAPFEAAFAALRALAESLRRDGLAVSRLDLGGGLGVPYFNQPDPPTPAEYAAMAARAVGGLGLELAFEPGRVIAANAGVLIARVLHINARPDGRRFLVLDAGMNDLIRPAMYEAWHDIRPVRPRRGARGSYDVVGPVCETSDTFARDRILPPLEGGDLVAFMTAGAYGAVMSSEYNARALAPEVLVRGAEFAVVRERPSYEEMFRREPIAPWLLPTREGGWEGR
jgi:diaminopimelate decarboxylase